MADGALIRNGLGFAHGATRPARMAWLLSTTMLGALITGFGGGPALAKPRGGSVAAGQATIVDSGKTTTIQQGSAKAIINWQDFSIGKGEAVRFQQPSRNAIALNRVTGDAPSNLLGTLTANGNVWLVNPNGVFIGPSATISAGGFLATTSDILDTDFMKANYAFTQPSPVAGATVANEGLISVADTGLAALVAPHVRNDGMIIGRLGTVVLAGTPTFTLDLQGDGLLHFAVGEGAVERMAGDAGRVEMGGRIDNDGGDVLIAAAAAAGIVDDVINVGGVIEARTVAERNGAIVLAGGDGGTVRIGGRLDATATDPAARGGRIDALGDRVIIEDAAVIDASGSAGGGTLRIGGDQRGSGNVRTASLTGVAENAVLKADATAVGDGGRIVVWARDYADVRGELSARGGPLGGDGGFIETSSAGGLWLTPRVDTRAPRGTAGSWLIDPTDVQITASSGNPGSERVPPVFAADPDPAGGGPVFVLTSVLAAATSPVIIEATRNVDVVSPVAMGTDLSLQAGNTLTLAQPVVTTGNVSLSAATIREVGAGAISAAHLDLRATAPNSVAELRANNTVGSVTAGPAAVGNGDFANVRLNNVGNLTVGDANGGSGIAADSVFVTVNRGTLTIAAPIEAATTVELASVARDVGDVGPPLQSRVGGALNLDADITVSGAGGSVLLGGTFIDQDAGTGISAPALGIVAMASGGGGVPDISLSGTNAVDALTFKPIDVVTAPIATVAFHNQQDLAFVNGQIGSVDFSDRPAQADAIRLVIDGGLTVEKSLVGTGAGTSILISAQTLDNSELGINGFIANPAGAGGRFLIYTQDPRSDQRNYDGSFGKRYGFPFNASNAETGIPAGKSLPAGGNFFLYEVVPTLTLEVANASRPVGQANPPFTFQSGGLIDGDTLEDALAGGGTGLQLVTTANVLSPAGGYPITFAPPPAPSALGYDLDVSNGTLTVTGGQPPNPPPPLDDLRDAVIPVESQVTQPEDILQDRAATQQADLAHGQPQVLGESTGEPRRVSPIPKQRAERLGDPLFANGGNRSLWSP